MSESEQMVTVRWLGEHVIQIGVGGPRVLPGGTFQMTRGEADQRDDVEVVEPENSVVVEDNADREPEPDTASPPEHEADPDSEPDRFDPEFTV